MLFEMSVSTVVQSRYHTAGRRIQTVHLGSKREPSDFVHVSTSMTTSLNVEPFSVAIAFSASSAVANAALPCPPFPIETNWQLPASFMCSRNALFRSLSDDSISGKPPIQTFL